MIPHILSTPAVDASIKIYDFANLYTENQEELISYLEENKLCYHQVATVETLEYLRK